MRDKRHIVFFGLILLALVPFVLAQNTNRTVTLRGTISDVSVSSNDELHVWLQEGPEVCMGSAQFLKDKGIFPGVGESIEVTGISVGNRGIFRADTLQRAGTTTMLRHVSAGQGRSGCRGGNCGHDCEGHHHHSGHDCAGHCCGHD